MNEDNSFLTINKSLAAPINGVYRYVLIPAEKPVEYYIDLFYVYGLGTDEEVLETVEDTVYLSKGERLIIDSEGTIKVEKKERHLKLVVING
jgi:hypothetical protein